VGSGDDADADVAAADVDGSSLDDAAAAAVKTLLSSCRRRCHCRRVMTLVLLLEQFGLLAPLAARALTIGDASVRDTEHVICVPDVPSMPGTVAYHASRKRNYRWWWDGH
jgi:hypothetical protein